MATRHRPVPVRRLVNQAATDPAFRAHVLEDGRAAQCECCLPESEWQKLVAETVAIDAELARDPFQPTEVDHGEADAAGAKG